MTRPAFQFAGAGLFAAAAVVLVVETTPFAGENAMPIPQSKGAASEIDISDSTPPELTGPDDVPRAGVISVSADRVRIEGESVADLDALSARLGELRRVDQLMRPEEPFTGRLVVIVDRDVRGARLAGVAEAVKRAGYVEWSLVLSVRGETQERPLLGTQRALNTTSVRVHVDGHEGAERVTVAPDERFDDLARRLVDLRQGGREVALVFGP